MVRYRTFQPRQEQVREEDEEQSPAPEIRLPLNRVGRQHSATNDRGENLDAG